MTEIAEMVERLRAQGIRDPWVLVAMRAVPRERFVSPEAADAAYQETALDIGLGQTISTPLIGPFSTAALEAGPHARVLETGTGSGYGAAVLSRCQRSVVTIERHAELAERARADVPVGADEVLGAIGAPQLQCRQAARTVMWPTY